MDGLLQHGSLSTNVQPSLKRLYDYLFASYPYCPLRKTFFNFVDDLRLRITKLMAENDTVPLLSDFGHLHTKRKVIQHTLCITASKWHTTYRHENRAC